MSKDSFTPPQPLNTAVLFLVFNRLDTTKQVFEAIREAKPPRLYIAADGARETKAGEAEKVTAVRDFILKNIDWECDIKTLFREENLGCKYAVSGAIDWFFDNEEMGIILEDDCLPSQSFFWFCDELLERYKDEYRIGQISGTNVLGKYKVANHSYHFSNFGSIWGWATWKRAWKYYDITMQEFNFIKEHKLLESVITNKDEYKIRMKSFEETYNNKIDTWDYQWIYSRLINKVLIIIPSINLISNIGFGEDATHTNMKESPLNNKKSYEGILPLIHPKYMLANKEFEKLVHIKKHISFSKRIINKIRRSIWEKK
jgi:hypothetical protein